MGHDAGGEIELLVAGRPRKRAVPAIVRADSRCTEVARWL